MKHLAILLGFLVFTSDALAGFYVNKFKSVEPIANAHCVNAAANGVMIHEEISQTDDGKTSYYRIYLFMEIAFLHYVEVSANRFELETWCAQYKYAENGENIPTYLWDELE